MLFSLGLVLLPLALARSVVVEERDHPDSWKRSQSNLDPSTVFQLYLGLAQQNLHTLDDELHKISHPDSDSYGQHWTPQKVKEFFQPSEETVDSVKDWLSSSLGHDEHTMSPNGAWIIVDVTVSQAEELLETRYRAVEHSDSGFTSLACDSYSVPEHIRSHIDLIKPTVHYDHPAAFTAPSKPEIIVKEEKKLEPRKRYPPGKRQVSVGASVSPNAVSVGASASAPVVAAPAVPPKPVAPVVAVPVVVAPTAPTAPKAAAPGAPSPATPSPPAITGVANGLDPATILPIGSLKNAVLPGPKLLDGTYNTPSYPATSVGSPTELANCATAMTPNCLRTLYGFGQYKTVGNSNNGALSNLTNGNTVAFGIAEYAPQTYVASDLDMFFNSYSPKQVGSRPTLVSVAGGAVYNGPAQGFNYDGESNLDLSYAMALVGTGIPVTLYQAGTPTYGASFNTLLDAIDGSYCGVDGDVSTTCAQNAPRPNVLSTSYSYNEGDLTPLYEQRQCQEYAKLGLMGTTVLYSSGDYGVGGAGGTCYIAGTNNRYSGGGQQQRFNPAFPSTCPYVTSVGATQLKAGNLVTGINPEQACDQVIYSGGGFSNVFPLPSYQAAAVAAYYKSYAPAYTSSQYNNSQQARGFPDISANGAYYVVAVGGSFYRVFGTSASSPVIGSLITLINDARHAAGKAPVGFINPALYSAAFSGAITDITSGNNPGCGTNGFTAVPGWEPVTGLGTPKFQQLLNAFMNLA